MKTKISILAIMIVAFAIISCNNTSDNEEVNTTELNTEKATEYSLDLEKSVVNWEGSMIGLYSHYGTLNFSDGSLKIKEDKVVGGEFTVDLNSMIATDPEENYPMAPREKLIEHLQSDDFFATDKYPTSTFEITGESSSDLAGQLTIRGITGQEIVKDIKVEKNGDDYTITGKLVFDRQNYDVSYESTMKDKVLSNDIELEIKLVTTAK